MGPIGMPGEDGEEGQRGFPGADGSNAQISTDNWLINGGGDIWQRQTPGTDTSRADATYAADRWYVLTQSNPINVKRIAGQHTVNAHRLTQSNASSQRIGYAQWIESKSGNLGIYDSPAIYPNVALALQGKVKISNGGVVRYAILGWSGAVDAPTRDVINTWTSTTYTPGNFFISTSIGVLAVGSITPLSSVWTPFRLDVTSDPTWAYSNYCVVIWTEAAAAQNVTMDLAELSLTPFNPNAIPTLRLWYRRPFQQELELCQRFYEKSTDVEVAPVDGAASDSNLGCAFDTGSIQAIYTFKVAKRTTPVVTPFRTSLGGSAGQFAYLNAATVWIDGTTTTFFASTNNARGIFQKTGGPFVYAGGYSVQCVWAADAEF